MIATFTTTTMTTIDDVQRFRLKCPKLVDCNYDLEAFEDYYEQMMIAAMITDISQHVLLLIEIYLYS